jgi:solute carrier family 25 carnitine/acylcarnitine transporter 20/29
MLSPTLAEVPCTAVMFAVYEAVYRELCPDPYSNRAYVLQCKYFCYAGLLSGGISGFAYAMVVCPAEMVKCVLQM